MKNIIIAALTAAQIMEKWAVYCTTQSDITWSTFGFFFLALILLRQVDKYLERQRRMRRTVLQIKRLSGGGYHGKQNYIGINQG